MFSLVCGDLHAKYHILDKVDAQDSKNHYDKIIFLGDYVDDWDTPAEVSYNLLERLISWKKAEPDKIVLLLGNHDLSEWLAGNFACSGFSEYAHRLLRPMFEVHKSLFQVAYADDGVLYTHAGVTKSWLRSICPNWTGALTAENVAEYLNLEYLNFCNGVDRHFECFDTCGTKRGGHQHPSPVWADKEELEEDSLDGVAQVVGHTPVSTIVTKRPKDQYHLLRFCDTHSTNPDGSNIGDNAFLNIYSEKGI